MQVNRFSADGPRQGHAASRASFFLAQFDLTAGFGFNLRCNFLNQIEAEASVDEQSEDCDGKTT